MSQGYLITLYAIECRMLNEGGDEIYYLVNGVEQRPPGDPDYWFFDDAHKKRIIQRTVLDGPENTEVLVSLREQDGGLRFDHDRLGDVLIKVAGGAVSFVEKSGTTYMGKRRGYHVVDFHDSDGVYSLHFLARVIQAI
ncbi:MAG: hypothetical protein U0271_13995 [Polyangiaceae bacterium]